MFRKKKPPLVLYVHRDSDIIIPRGLVITTDVVELHIVPRPDSMSRSAEEAEWRKKFIEKSLIPKPWYKRFLNLFRRKH